ncbi:MAG: hypothetical protein B6D44_03580 [Ignavibacteriales bacterium UTCHB2]|jgi:hypothetical protein|nr:MAG: hypothetical protein B6D44_03580 [Ignavibacteriales bacterium UTCHB2]HOR61160.1 hypothetical protein [Bacteroidales bacterium]
MIDENVKNIKDILLIMIKAGAFDVKNGSVTLNFNSNGDLMNIQVEQLIYKKIKPNYDDKKIQNAEQHIKQGLDR